VDECEPLGAGDGLEPAHHLLLRHGRAVHVDPIKPTLTAPGTKRLKLKYYILLSTFAFKVNLRRYDTCYVRFCASDYTLEAGAYTRPLLSST
jgi:hypothetical protein